MTTQVLDPFNPNTWNERERAYFNAINEGLEGPRNLLFSNGKAEHAAYLIEKFLANAQKIVRIFSGKLTRNFNGVDIYMSAHIVDAARKLLDNQGEIKIVVQHEVDVERGTKWKDHPFLCACINAGMPEDSVRKISPDCIETLRNEGVLCHWMTMDDHAYRLEVDTTRAEAMVNFKDPEMVRPLASIFDNMLFPSATPLVNFVG